MVTANEHE